MTAVLFTIAAMFLGVQLGTVILFMLRFGKRLQVDQAQPRISLLRPVCGIDAFEAETLASSFQQDYPDYEVIFCVGRADDAVVPLVRRLIAAHPQISARLLVGMPGQSGNPKLDNLWKGWDAASSEWICMADSNLLLPRDYLTTLMLAWTPDTGMVSAPAIGSRVGNLGGAVEAAFLNSNQARLQFASDSLGQGFAQGKTLFFNHKILTRAGGLHALDRFMAEDASATVAIRSLGLKVTLPPLPFEQPVGRKSLRQVWVRQLRWSRLRRDAFPGLFMCEIANGAALPTLVFAAALASAGAAPVWILAWLALWYGAEIALMRRAGWPASLRDMLVLPLRDAVMLAIWFATLRAGNVEWRGTTVLAGKAKAA
jgi:ceramide glucosyltransferase